MDRVWRVDISFGFNSESLEIIKLNFFFLEIFFWILNIHNFLVRLEYEDQYFLSTYEKKDFFFENSLKYFNKIIKNTIYLLHQNK